MNTIDQSIAALRAQMSQAKLDAYIIPSSDPHQSEYPAEHWNTRSWVSGFTGSAGLAIVTQDHAGVWTDSRYFLQAEEQLADSEFELHKQLIPHAPEHIDWLCQQLSKGQRVGCDGLLFSLGQINRLGKALDAKGIELDYQHDLIPAVWADRPALPKTPIFEHALHYTGQSRQDKLALIQQKIQAQGATACLLTTLDDIAWTFNLRGSDVECNPVFVAYAIVGANKVQLFMDQEKIPAPLQTQLEQEGIEILPYRAITAILDTLKAPHRLLVDKDTVSISLYDLIDEEVVLSGPNVPRQLKAIKNDTEVGHIKAAMLKDGVALTRLYRWLDQALEEDGITEVDVSQKLDQLRRAQGDYHGESFSAIVGYNGNGAIVHYRPTPGSCATLRKEGILLLDSGGQYTNGTTDITRTTALGEPTEEQRRNFTLVLKGHIALARLRFPKGTRGIQMDTLARQPLWEHMLNYGHGTGHGVGFFLNVHEPPQGFAASISQRGTTPFEEGMFTSNEPGFYKTGEYGIRIENLVLTRTAGSNEFGTFLEFETLTLFPIDLRLIDVTLLSPEEKNWLNSYHAEVNRQLAPLLDEEEKAWMADQCRAI
ncbi:MAG: aminopeptidase P family protein [Bacteroidota bacterium]